MKTVAIVGGGFAGLASAVYCIQKGYQVHLYDRKGIGAGASGIAAGLLHCYAGAHAKKNRFADASIIETQKLLILAQGICSEPFYQQRGIYRLAFNEEQRTDYFKSSQLYLDIEWIENVQTVLPHAPLVPAIYIASGMTVMTGLYLQALWKYCKQQGACFFVREILEPEELQEERVILTTGSSLIENPLLKLTPVKGQILELEWPNLPPLPCAISSKVYIVMNGSLRCWVGGTFEKIFHTAEADIETASLLLLGATEQLYPPLVGAKVLGCAAAIRVSTPDHLPVYGRWPSSSDEQRLYYLGGLGSKGLLYHAYYAKKLVNDFF